LDEGCEFLRIPREKNKTEELQGSGASGKDFKKKKESAQLKGKFRGKKWRRLAPSTETGDWDRKKGGR